MREFVTGFINRDTRPNQGMEWISAPNTWTALITLNDLEISGYVFFSSNQTQDVLLEPQGHTMVFR
jgi:hypothetical protein